MAKMLALDGMKVRISTLISFRSKLDTNIREAATLPLYHLFAAGPTPRGEFIQMTGLPERSGPRY
jgi:hypothetical protein